MKKNINDFIFYAFILCIIFNRLLLLVSVNDLCIDNDQVVMWAGAKDFSEMKFHVPLFYGQDYNTMLEAFIAVPFIWLLVPIHLAVPIATHSLFLFPVLFSAIYLFKKQHKQQAIITLSLLLCMPVGYDIITSVPRGFVTGLFFSSFFIISILNPNNYKWLAINTFLSGIAYLANPNSVIISAPFLVFVFLHHFKNKIYYYVSLSALAPVALLYLWIHSFYISYKNPLVYQLNNQFGFTYFRESLSNLSKRFMYVSFFNEGYSFGLFILLLALAILLFIKNKKAFIAILILFAVIIISLFTSKAADGSEWAFYSYSRLYIGIPIAMYLFLSLLDVKTVVLPISFITVIFFVIKTIGFNDAIKHHSDEKKWSHLNLISYTDLQNYITGYFQASKKHDVTCFIIDHVWRDDFLNYAAGIICPDFPNTFKPSFERRSWLINEYKLKIVDRFLIVIRDPKNIELLNNSNSIKLDDYGLFLVQNNTLTIEEFLNKINCPIYKGD